MSKESNRTLGFYVLLEMSQSFLIKKIKNTKQQQKKEAGSE